jgi:serine/threonine-protein kinase
VILAREATGARLDVSSMTSEDSTIGRLLAGRYRVIRRLGEGGMGSVYEAEHVQLGRRVAIKLLHEHHATSIDLRTRFEREARMLSQLRHPNVVTITDFGIDDGKPFLVMDLLSGRDLASLIKEGRVAPERAIGIVRQILRGVAHAHARGLVHRDLKPHNVMIEVLEDGSDHVTVLDFGLARDTAGGSGTLTRSGIVVGTPAYMAPEQAGGGSADARADVYALGNVLFELLAGRRPFPFSEAHELLRAHLLTPPPSLKETCHDLDVPPELDALVARALAKEARDRYPDAAAMLAAIDTTPVPRPRSGQHPLEGVDPRRTMPARPRSGATGSDAIEPRTSHPDGARDRTSARSGAPGGSGEVRLHDVPLAHATTERPPPMPAVAKPSRTKERVLAIAALVSIALGVAVFSGGDDGDAPTTVAGGPSESSASEASNGPTKRATTPTKRAPTKRDTTPFDTTHRGPADRADTNTSETTSDSSSASATSERGALWSPVPAELVPMYERLAEGGALARHQEQRLAVLIRRQPDDPRPAILLAHEYVRARSFTAALEPIEEAVKRDPRAVGNDPWAVADLVTLVASSATNRKAVPLARRAKSARMRAEVAARIATSNEEDARRLRAFARGIR